jgi:hypothetical protein
VGDVEEWFQWERAQWRRGRRASTEHRVQGGGEAAQATGERRAERAAGWSEIEINLRVQGWCAIREGIIVKIMAHKHLIYSK